MLERSKTAGVQSMIITGTSLAESKQALEMAQRYGASGSESFSMIPAHLPPTDLYATVGCHPTSTSEIAKRANVEDYFHDLESVIQAEANKGPESRAVAIGEIGLGKGFFLEPHHPLTRGTDYDRLHYSDVATQKAYFPRLLKLGDIYSLPLFLHSRHPDAHIDFVKTLKDAGWEQSLEPVEGQADPNARLPRGRLGVVHSFTGTVDEMRELVRTL